MVEDGGGYLSALQRVAVVRKDHAVELDWRCQGFFRRLEKRFRVQV